MKTNNRTLSMSLFVGITIILSLLTLESCEKASFQPASKIPKKGDIDLKFQIEEEAMCGAVFTEQILVGRQITGIAYVYNDIKFLYVDIISQRGYTFKNSYLFVGSLDELPMTFNGNLNFNKFNHAIIPDEQGRAFRYKIPLEDIEDIENVIYASMKVEVIDLDEQKIKDGWINGKPIETNGPGMIFKHELSRCLIIDPIPVDNE